MQTPKTHYAKYRKNRFTLMLYTLWADINIHKKKISYIFLPSKRLFFPQTTLRTQWIVCFSTFHIRLDTRTTYFVKFIVNAVSHQQHHHETYSNECGGCNGKTAPVVIVIVMAWCVRECLKKHYPCIGIFVYMLYGILAFWSMRACYFSICTNPIWVTFPLCVLCCAKLELSLYVPEL